MSVSILMSLAVQSRRLATEHTEAGRESEARLATSEAITHLVKATMIMNTVWSGLSSDSARIKYAAGRRQRLQINHMLQQAYVDLSRDTEALVCAEAGRAQSLELLLTQQRQQHYHDASGAESVNAPPNQISIENIVDFVKAQSVCIIYYSVVQNGRELERSSLNRTRTRVLAWVVSSLGVITCHPFVVPDSLAHLVEMTRRCMGASERVEVRSAADTSVPAIDTDLLQKEMGSLLAAEDATSKLLRRCHDTFIAPLAQEVASERRLIIVPDQELYALPFAALLDADGKYLIQKHSIRLAPSIGSIIEIGKRATNAGAVRALVVGGPDYTSWTNSSGEHLSELKGAKEEAKEVARLLEKVFPDDLDDEPTVDRLVGKKATKAAVTAALGSSKLVHLAAHGGAQSIYLAGPNAEDATLTMGEVQQMTLSARLVVLSACDSFGGKLGTDGVVGVSRAFLAAGAQTVVSSLWKVSDTATLELMKRFYQMLISITDPAEAMQAAMVSMVEDESYKVLDWASFVVYGMGDLPAPVIIEAANEGSGGGGSPSDGTRAAHRPHPYARSVTDDRLKCAVSGPSEVARNLTTFTLRAWVLLQSMMADLKEELDMYKEVLQSTSTKKAAGVEKFLVYVSVAGCEVSNDMTWLPCPSEDEPLMHSHHQVIVPGDFSADRFDCTARITTEDMSKDFLNTSFSLPRVASTKIACDFLEFSVRLECAESKLKSVRHELSDHTVQTKQQLQDAKAQLNSHDLALGLHDLALVNKVKRASVRIGIYKTATKKLISLGSGTLIDAGPGAPVGQVLSAAHLFVKAYNPALPPYVDPNIDWNSTTAPFLILVGMYQADDQPSRWEYWAELITPLNVLQATNPLPWIKTLVDLAVLRIRGEIEMSPAVFTGPGLSETFEVVNRSNAATPLSLPDGIQLGEPLAVQTGISMVTVFGWFAPKEESTLYVPQHEKIISTANGLLISQALLHTAGSGGAQVDSHGRLLAVNSRSSDPAIPMPVDYKAYGRMISDLLPAHGLET